MQVMGKPRPCSSPASPSLAEAISFGLCDLEPAAVDGLQQPVPDCLEPGSCSSKPGHFSTPNGWLGIWADVVTATPNHAPGLPSQRVLQHRHGMSETRRKTPPRCPQLCRGFSWEAFAFTCSEHSLVRRLAGPAGVLGAAPRPWGCGAAGGRCCKLPGIGLSALLLALQGLSHRKDIVRTGDCSGRTGCTKRDCFAVK